MEITLENSRGLLLFLIPTIIITIVLFIFDPPGILLLIGFIVLLIAGSGIYYLGLNFAEKNKKIPFIVLILFIIIGETISEVIFLVEPPSIVAIIGLAVLFTMYSVSWYGGAKKMIE